MRLSNKQKQSLNFDLAISVLGEFSAVSALTTTQYPRVKVGDNPSLQPRSTSDHVFLQVQLTSGLTIAIEVAGGRPAQALTHFEVIGTGGKLILHGGAMRGVQSGRLHLMINDEAQLIYEGAAAALPDAAANVAGIYAMLRDDILWGKHKIEILCVLSAKPARLGQLTRLIPSASKKVLTENLRQLEASGIITRHDLSGSVRHIEYSLVHRMNQPIHALLNQLESFGELHQLSTNEDISRV